MPITALAGKKTNLEGANRLSSSQAGGLCIVPYALFQCHILIYLECPTDDSNLRKTCKYLQKSPLPKIVHLSLLSITEEDDFALKKRIVDKYQKNGKLHTLKTFLNMNSKDAQGLTAFVSLLGPDPIPSLKRLYVNFFKSEYLSLFPSLEELHLLHPPGEFLLYKTIENISKLTKLRIFGLSLLYHQNGGYIQQFTDNLKNGKFSSLTNLKKFILSFSYAIDPKLALAMTKSFPGLLNSSLEEIEIFIPLSNEPHAQNSHFGFLNENLLQQIANSTVHVRINGRLLPNRNQPPKIGIPLVISSTESNLPSSTPLGTQNDSANEPPQTSQELDSQSAPANPLGILGTNPGVESNLSPLTTLVTQNDSANGQETTSSPLIPHTGIFYCLSEFCLAMGRMIANLIDWFRACCVQT